MMTQHDAPHRDDTAALAALAELVRLKDGPRDGAYERDKPRAWEQARAVLAGRSLDPQALYADAVNLTADRSPFGHPLPESEIRAAYAGVDAALTAVRAGASQPQRMHEFWETTDDVEALRTALREQGQMVRALSERNTELVLAADRPHDVDPAAPVCVWCESLASGTAEHNDGVRYPACAKHGLPGTYVAAGAR